MPGCGSQSKRGKLLSAGLVIQILDLPASYKWFIRVRGPAATQANLGYFENPECDKIDRFRGPIRRVLLTKFRIVRLCYLRLLLVIDYYRSVNNNR